MSFIRKFLVDEDSTIKFETIGRKVLLKNYFSLHPVITLTNELEFHGKEDYEEKCFLSNKGEETEITKNIYLNYCRFFMGKDIIINKKIVKLPDSNYLLNMNTVNFNENKELKYASIEFPTEKEAKEFFPPSYLGEEITDNLDYDITEVYKNERLKELASKKQNGEPNDEVKIYVRKDK